MQHFEQFIPKSCLITIHVFSEVIICYYLFVYLPFCASGFKFSDITERGERKAKVCRKLPKRERQKHCARFAFTLGGCCSAANQECYSVLLFVWHWLQFLGSHKYQFSSLPFSVSAFLERFQAGGEGWLPVWLLRLWGWGSTVPQINLATLHSTSFPIHFH
jgi:hypothetical protein